MILAWTISVFIAATIIKAQQTLRSRDSRPSSENSKFHGRLSSWSRFPHKSGKLNEHLSTKECFHFKNQIRILVEGVKKKGSRMEGLINNEFDPLHPISIINHPWKPREFQKTNEENCIVCKVLLELILRATFDKGVTPICITQRKNLPIENYCNELHLTLCHPFYSMFEQMRRKFWIC